MFKLFTVRIMDTIKGYNILSDTFKLIKIHPVGKIGFTFTLLKINKFQTQSHLCLFKKKLLTSSITGQNKNVINNFYSNQFI